MRGKLRIKEDDLSGAAIAALLREHVQGMFDTSPPDSVHTLSLDALRAADIVVWSAWLDNELAGCGALKVLDAHSGEIKSMRTASRHLGKGVGSAVLRHIIAVAESRGYQKLLLETGSTPDFDSAHRLYKRFGFRYRGPFADYREDPFSRYMQLSLGKTDDGH